MELATFDMNKTLVVFRNSIKSWFCYFFSIWEKDSKLTYHTDFECIHLCRQHFVIIAVHCCMEFFDKDLNVKVSIIVHYLFLFAFEANCSFIVHYHFKSKSIKIRLIFCYQFVTHVFQTINYLETLMEIFEINNHPHFPKHFSISTLQIPANKEIHDECYGANTCEFPNRTILFSFSSKKNSWKLPKWMCLFILKKKKELYMKVN